MRLAIIVAGESIVEVLRRENSVLRRDSGQMREELNEMKKVLGHVNSNIYGKRAAEMCKSVAMGGKGSAVRVPLGNKTGNQKKIMKAKPFKV